MRYGILRGRELGEVADDEIDYELDTPDAIAGSHASMLPLTNNVTPTRGFYGARFVTQGWAAKNREAPLVQRRIQGTDKSFEDYYGKELGALFSSTEGKVTKITPDFIELDTEDGKTRVNLAHNLPMNRKSGLTHEVRVKVGDAVAKGQLMADSNYTRDGTAALGVNARVALGAYKGFSMDDASVVSRSMANKMTSDAMYGYSQEYDDTTRYGKTHFTSVLPRKFTTAQLDKLDENGIVKPGVTLEPGDPIALATKPKPISSRSTLGGLTRGSRDTRVDASQVWDHNAPAVVTDALFKGGKANVYVRADVPVQEGDKAVFRNGQKFTISKILEDDQMPRTKDGKPLDILLNQYGIPSRSNLATPYAILAGKVAAKRGAPLKLDGFTKPGEDRNAIIARMLAEEGLTEDEEIFDPEENRFLESPMTVGNEYVIRLHHSAESKLGSRGTGAYTSNEQPARGGDESQQAKRVSNLEITALLSSGAYKFARENSTVRGQKSYSFWKAVREGQSLPEVGAPFVWEKFKHLLSGSGLRMKEVRKGQLRLGPMTDRDVDERTPMEIKSGDTINFDTLEPIKGGLFDTVLTDGGRWGVVNLPFPVPNPSQEDSVRKILGITEKKMREVIAGKSEL